MKRVTSFLVFLLLLSAVFSSTAFAGYSFWDMTDEELLQVATAVNEEVVKRYKDEVVELTAGLYTVGQDVLAGEYLVMIGPPQAEINVWETDGGGNY